jgi:hypothetical protein
MGQRLDMECWCIAAAAYQLQIRILHPAMLGALLLSSQLPTCLQSLLLQHVSRQQ